MTEFEQGRTMFVCPFKDTDECPRIERYAENNLFIDLEPCNKSPIVSKEDGASICCVLIDLNEPGVNKSIANLGRYLEFRNLDSEEENKNE